MALPYPMSPVSPFDVITSQAENEKIANIESLADGTGIDDGAITAPKIDFTTFPDPQSVYVATDSSTNSGTYVDLGSAQSVTLNVPQSGRVTVVIRAGMYNGAHPKWMSFALSGANTLVADDARAIRSDQQTFTSMAEGTFFLSGLTPGVTTFTAKLRSNGTLFGQYFGRTIQVKADI